MNLFSYQLSIVFYDITCLSKLRKKKIIKITSKFQWSALSTKSDYNGQTLKIWLDDLALKRILFLFLVFFFGGGGGFLSNPLLSCL